MGVTDAVVVDDEFVDTIGVGHAELGFELTGTFVLHGGANERIDANEFQLNVSAVEGHPFAMDEFVEVDIEYLERRDGDFVDGEARVLTRSFLIV